MGFLPVILMGDNSCITDYEAVKDSTWPERSWSEFWLLFKSEGSMK